MSDMFGNGDYQRIQALFAEYAWSFDQADLETLAQIFAYGVPGHRRERLRRT